MLVAKLPPVLLPSATVDMLFLSYYAWKCIREVLFLLHILYLFAFMSTGHMKEMNRSLRIGLSQSTPTVLNKCRCLDFFYNEYGRLLEHARYVNSHLVSPIMFAALLTQLTLNLMTIGFLLFRRLYPGEQLMLLCFVGLQFIIFPIGCLGLASCSEVFNRSSGLLYRAQLGLNVNDPQTREQKQQQLYKRALLITVKLKLMIFFEQVCRRRGDEFRFTVGSICKISRRTLYEFAFLYSSLVMYVVKMMQKGRLEKN